MIHDEPAYKWATPDDWTGNKTYRQHAFKDDGNGNRALCCDLALIGGDEMFVRFSDIEAEAPEKFRCKRCDALIAALNSRQE